MGKPKQRPIVNWLKFTGTFAEFKIQNLQTTYKTNQKTHPEAENYNKNASKQKLTKKKPNKKAN